MKNYLNMLINRIAKKLEEERLNRMYGQVAQEIYISSPSSGGSEVYLFVKGVPVNRVTSTKEQIGDLTLEEAQNMLVCVRNNRLRALNNEP
ncbi:MAG: hypothetical protein ACI4SO_06730 [Muribaculaceae bacterium]